MPSRPCRVPLLARQRGATMVSVMLLSVSLMTVGLLVVRSSVRQVEQAGQLVARERALMAAQAAADLAAAQYLRMNENTLNEALTGYSPQTGDACTDACGDCIPERAVLATGSRNDVLAGDSIGCGGKPCMRQGAVTRLLDSAGGEVDWCDVPMRDLVPGGDAEARVSVWVRNNGADALGPNGSASWTDDNDGRVVITAMATIRNTAVTIEQEVVLNFGTGTTVLMPQSPDEGYGGGHNNDNSAVSVCVDDYVAAAAN
jgi:hypothetical protein